MFRLFVFIWLTAFVLFLNWLLDWPPTDPPVTPSHAAARQAILDLPVQLDFRDKRLGAALDRLARDHQAPLAGLHASDADWREALLTDVATWDQPLRLEDALWLLQWLTHHAFDWEWQGRELAIRSPGWKPDLHDEIRELITLRNLAGLDQAWNLRTFRPRDVEGPAPIRRWLGTRASDELLARLADREVTAPSLALSPGALAAHEAAEGALEREIEWEAGEIRLDQLLLGLQRQLRVNFVVTSSTLENKSVRAAHQVTSPRGRHTVQAGLMQVLQPLGLTLQIEHGFVFIGTPRWCQQNGYVRAYPLWAYQALWPTVHDASEALEECEELVQWRFGGIARASSDQDQDKAVILFASRDLHQEFETLLDGLAESRASAQGGVVLPAFDPRVEQALNSRLPLATEPAPLAEFAAGLTRQLGIEVRVDRAIGAPSQLLSGDGQGGTVAQQLDRILLPRRLDYLERHGGLRITTQDRAWQADVRFYPLEDLLPSELERPPASVGRLARDACDWNPLEDLVGPGLPQRALPAFFLRSTLAGDIPRRRPPGNLMGLRQEQVRSSTPFAGGLAARLTQREQRAMAAAMDRRGPFVAAVSGLLGTREARRQALAAALDSRDPLASAWAVCNLTKDEVSDLQPKLLAAFASGALHQSPQPQHGVSCTGLMAWEMLRDKTPPGELAAALEAMAKGAGATSYAEVTFMEALNEDPYDLTIARAALHGLVSQEGSLAVDVLLRHEACDADGACRRARALACEAYAARWTAGVAEAFRHHDSAAAEQELSRVVQLAKHAPPVWDDLKALVCTPGFTVAGAVSRGQSLLAPVYCELLRDSDPEVRRLACREMTGWMLAAYPPNRQALKTLLGDPLLAAEAAEVLRRYQPAER